MSASADAPLPADAAALLAEYYRYADLADHLRGVPAAAACLGVHDVSPEYRRLLDQLEDVVLDRLTRLDALGLYPATTTDVEVTVNGVPIALPELERAAQAAAPCPSGVAEGDHRMETILHESEHDLGTNGFDPAIPTDAPEESFVDRYVRPYAAHLALFTAGAIVGVVGARWLGGATDLTV